MDGGYNEKARDPDLSIPGSGPFSPKINHFPGSPLGKKPVERF